MKTKHEFLTAGVRLARCHWLAVPVLAMSVVSSVVAQSATFVPDDIQVCPAAAGVRDPEFDNRGARIIFTDAQQRLKVAAIRGDGTINSANCRGQVIDSGLMLSLPGVPLLNGAEWAYSQNGTEIFYTKPNAAGQPSLVRAWKSTTWQKEFLVNGEDRGMPIPTRDQADLQARILYWRQNSDGSTSALWRESKDPSSERPFPSYADQGTGGAPRWVPKQRAITTVVADASGLKQAARYFIDSGTLEALTTDDGEKDEVWMWSAPEFGGDLVFSTVVNGCCIRIYRQIAGTWSLINTIKAGDFSSRSNIFSPEPFVYKKRSYIAMQLASGSRYFPSDIWIAAIDPANPLIRQVSDPTTPGSIRNEPEVYVTSTAAYVYYTQVEASGFTLRRARTGL